MQTVGKIGVDMEKMNGMMDTMSGKMESMNGWIDSRRQVVFSAQTQSNSQDNHTFLSGTRQYPEQVKANQNSKILETFK